MQETSEVVENLFNKYVNSQQFVRIFRSNKNRQKFIVCKTNKHEEPLQILTDELDFESAATFTENYKD